jgi:uncharacterized repeat protein (TIGR03803 family)
MKANSKKLFRCISALSVLVANLMAAEHAGAQTWSTNSPLNVARWAHTSTLLTNGSVLVAGGLIYNTNGNSADTNAAELYNPSSGTSSPAAPMQSSRHAHRATLLTNGQVLVTGGGGDSSSETYDPPSDTWINYTSMSDERIVHTATLLPNGQVLAAAGFSDNSGLELSSAELYDPNSGTWNNTTSMPYAADTLASALLTNGTVLVCGGFNGTNAVTNAVLYNPANQTWTNTAPMHEGRSGHTATLLPNGKVLVEGGTSDNTAEVYDPVAATWTLVASMNDGRKYSDAVLLNNGQVMVLGDGNPDVELYDPVGDTWTLTNSLPVPGHQQTATLVSGGAVVVTGGSVTDFNGPPLAVVETYGSGSTIPNLVVTASPQAGLAPLTVQFTSPGTDSGGNTVTNWSWSFGDGGTSTAQSPSHVYTNIGSYSPGLTAYSTYGASPISVTGPGTITVTNPALNVTASPQAGPVPLTVQFSSPGVDSTGHTVTNWNWSFGDGGVSTAQNPLHVYTNIGSYSPALTAYSTYGATPLSVTGPGTITVTNTPNPSFRILYTFTTPFGSGPNGGLAISNNTLFGTTFHGGTGSGTVFAVSTDGTGFTNVYDFGAGSGGDPAAGVILSGGTLYGTTYLGGTQGGGTVFAINTNGTGYTNVYNFTLNVPSTGTEPAAAVVLSGNTLYGTTQFGGGSSAGVVFAVPTTGGSITDLHSFSPPIGDFRMNPDGDGPLAGLLLSGGVLYGTAEAGGPAGSGTVFSVPTNSPGGFNPLYSFSSTTNASGTNTDGAFPFSRLVISGGTLYGTTYAGGKSGNGVVFAVGTNGTHFTNLYSFTGGNDGSGPHGGLTLLGNTLYGTTSAGGTSSNGTLFAINTDGSNFRTLYSFTGGGDGANPQADLLLSGNTLYGTAASGGISGNGTVFGFALPNPPLAITRSGTNVILTWSAGAYGYALQSSSHLGAAAAWNPVSPLPVNLNGLNTVTNGITNTSMFYRLSQ